MLACPQCKEVREGESLEASVCGHRVYRVAASRLSVLRRSGYSWVRVEAVPPGELPETLLQLPLEGSWQITQQDGERPGVSWIRASDGSCLWLTAGQGRAVIQAITHPMESGV